MTVDQHSLVPSIHCVSFVIRSICVSYPAVWVYHQLMVFHRLQFRLQVLSLYASHLHCILLTLVHCNTEMIPQVGTLIAPRSQRVALIYTRRLPSTFLPHVSWQPRAPAQDRLFDQYVSNNILLMQVLR